MSNKLFPFHQTSFDFAQVDLLNRWCASFELDSIPDSFTFKSCGVYLALEGVNATSSFYEIWR